MVAIRAPAFAGQLTVQSYTGAAPSSSYPDTGGLELNDGITFSKAWTVPGSANTTADVVALSGWLLVEPVITFTFATPTTIRSVSAWFADSDGSAGVGVPASVRLYDVGAGFDQTFPLINPPTATARPRGLISPVSSSPPTQSRSPLPELSRGR